MNTRTDTPMSEDELPIDPDIQVDDPHRTGPATRPVHLRLPYVTLVAAGAFFGTGVRCIVSTLLPADNGVSWSVFWINVAGALLLGVLLESLARRGPDAGRRRTLRLLLGTGFLGGFTTYSTLAEATAHLFLLGRGLEGTGYALLTVVVGAIATGTGLTVAGRLKPRPEAIR